MVEYGWWTTPNLEYFGRYKSMAHGPPLGLLCCSPVQLSCSDPLHLRMLNKYFFWVMWALRLQQGTSRDFAFKKLALCVVVVSDIGLSKLWASPSPHPHPLLAAHTHLHGDNRSNRRRMQTFHTESHLPFYSLIPIKWERAKVGVQQEKVKPKYWTEKKKLKGLFMKVWTGLKETIPVRYS